MTEKSVITKLPHHEQHNFCHTRPPYRQGKKLTSVKVYTVNDESQHLLIVGVPKLQLTDEINKLVFPYGIIKKVLVVPDYPAEEFTETYHVQYARIQSARIAKRFLDGKNFYGGLLHVFYAPELESVSETRAKLIQRRRDVAIRIKKNLRDIANPDSDTFVPKEQYHRKKKTPALPLTEDRLNHDFPGETLSSIYNGIPQNLDPRLVSEPSLPSCSYNQSVISSAAANELHAPYHAYEDIIKAAKTDIKSNINNKRKNYKGQSIKDNVKVRIVQPRVVDTSTIIKWDAPEKKVFSNPKKVDSNIKIKFIPKHDDGKKKIVIKNPGVTRLVQPSEDLQYSIKSVKSQIRAAMQAQDTPTTSS